MCLLVDKSIKPNKPDKDGFCIGWKIIKENNSALIQDGYFYNLGLNFSSLYYDADIGPNFSIGYKRIYEGFHLFLNKNGARKLWNFRKKRYDKDYIDNTKLIKVFYKPEDVVAYGKMEYSFSGDPINETPNVVVKKLTIKSLEGVRL